MSHDSEYKGMLIETIKSVVDKSFTVLIQLLYEVYNNNNLNVYRKWSLNMVPKVHKIQK